MTTGKKALYDPPRVGGDALTFCTRCKMELAHVIVSMVGGQPAKVQCKTCRSDHRFKKNGGATTSSKPRTHTPKIKVLASDHWEERMRQKHAGEMLNYSPKGQFAVGQVVKHPQFGMGIVEELKGPNKISVLFRVGEKLLVQGLS